MTAFPHLSSILCLYQGEAWELNALDMAFGLARRHGAHLRILHISVPPMRTLDPYGAAAYSGALINGSVIDQLVKDDDALIEAARNAVESAALRHSVPLMRTEMAMAVAVGPAAVFIVQEDYYEHAISLYGKTADLVISAQQPGGGQPEESRVLPALFDTGHGLLLVPSAPSPSYNADFMPRSVTIAWDGSLQAARALEKAMPLLADAADVYLVTVREKNEMYAPDARRAETARSLAGLGLRTSVLDIEMNDADVGEGLLHKAHELNADMLVMGAYGHNRIREALFGGASRYVLHHGDLPVLMSH